jgi:hypothetical protein
VAQPISVTSATFNPKINKVINFNSLALNQQMAFYTNINYKKIVFQWVSFKLRGFYSGTPTPLTIATHFATQQQTTGCNQTE